VSALRGEIDPAFDAVYRGSEDQQKVLQNSVFAALSMRSVLDLYRPKWRRKQEDPDEAQVDD
jgi:hypothetical protein